MSDAMIVPEINTKTCRRCWKVKDRSEFHYYYASKDKLQCYCKVCHSNQAKAGAKHYYQKKMVSIRQTKSIIREFQEFCLLNKVPPQTITDLLRDFMEEYQTF